MAIGKVIKYILESKDDNKHTALLRIDFKGAFDNVWRPALLYTLQNEKCPAKSL